MIEAAVDLGFVTAYKNGVAKEIAICSWVCPGGMIPKMRSLEDRTSPFNLCVPSAKLGIPIEVFILVDMPRAEALDTCQFLTHYGHDFTNADSSELDALKLKLFSTSMNTQYIKYHAASVTQALSTVKAEANVAIVPEISRK